MSSDSSVSSTGSLSSFEDIAPQAGNKKNPVVGKEAIKKLVLDFLKSDRTLSTLTFKGQPLRAVYIEKVESDRIGMSKIRIRTTGKGLESLVAFIQTILP